MKTISLREYLRRCAYREFPNMRHEKVERYLKELAVEHPEWNMLAKVDSRTGRFIQ